MYVCIHNNWKNTNKEKHAGTTLASIKDEEGKTRWICNIKVRGIIQTSGWNNKQRSVNIIVLQHDIYICMIRLDIMIRKNKTTVIFRFNIEIHAFTTQSMGSSFYDIPKNRGACKCIIIVITIILVFYACLLSVCPALFNSKQNCPVFTPPCV